MAFDPGTHIGYEDERGRAHCCSCMNDDEASGVMYLGDLSDAETDVTRCVVCGYRLVAFLFACDWCERDASDGVMVGTARMCRVCDVEHSPRADDVVGRRWLSVSDVVLCPSCFVEFCDEGNEDAHDVVSRREALALPEFHRRCDCCRDLLCW